MVALNIDNDARQKALLLHYAGEEVNDIFDTLPDTTPADGEKAIDKAVAALNKYFQPQANIAWEVHKFRLTKQQSDEDIVTFYTRLKQMSTTCEFTDADGEIKTQIIEKCSNNALRLKALDHANRTWTLTKLIETGRAMELSKIQAAAMEQVLLSEKVNQLSVSASKGSHFTTTSNNRHTQHRRYGKKHFQKASTMRQQSSVCRNCGHEWPHANGRTSCPAFGKECGKCHRQNHFAAYCMASTHRPKKYVNNQRKSNINTCSRSHNNNDDSDDANSYVYVMNENKSYDCPMFDVSVNGHQMALMADSGACRNLMDETDYNKMSPNKPQLATTKAKIYPYRSTVPLPIIGLFDATVDTGKRKCTETFYVVEGSSGSLLSWSTSKRLGLITTVEHLDRQPTSVLSTSTDALITQFSDLFDGLGKLKDVQVELHIDETVPAVAQPHRRIPFHVRKQLEEQLERDEKSGVIERVEGATPWVSPLVVVPKPKAPGQIRVCVDMREANVAIKRERHITPTISEIIHDLNGATVFSKLDLNQGYNQLELSPSSRYITTFSTHVGLWRYKRLNFGVSSAAEVFQNAIRNTLSGLSGAINISDDILVYGTTQAEHDANLHATFQRLRENKLTLNKAKCVYNKHTLEFFGYIFSQEGMMADPKKIKDIVELDTPTNASMVRSLLGMANFCARFIPGYATITEPLRKLTKKKSLWQWTEAHNTALNKIRSALTSAPVLAYFDLNKDTELLVDASPVGLGAILIQSDSNDMRHVVAYASRALTDVEQRYSQTEREALAVVWACERFHIYVYGKPVTILTDHKPLVHIYGNSRSKPPARIERWAMRLQPYDATVKYRAGADNPADYLSRHPTHSDMQSSREEKIAEEYVNYISTNCIPKAMSIESVRHATRTDITLQGVIAAIQTGKWHNIPTSPNLDIDTYNCLKRINIELTATPAGDLLLRGSRIVIPAALQKQAVSLAHEGHQGLVKTKALIREKVWFPGIDRLVEQAVESCIACQAATPQVKREPLQMSKLPVAPWKELSADFAELPGGDYLLVVIDDYSRFPVVEIINSTSARTVVPRFDRIFSEYGVPDVMRTDNGPPFNSREYKLFAESVGYKPRLVTPLWPRANGEAERFMKTIKKTIKAAKIENKCWKQEMYRFLRNYRATPHCTTGLPPATVLFNRSMKVKLPEIPFVESRPAMESRDAMAKHAMKTYADNKSYVKVDPLNIGDVVLVKRNPQYSKSDTPYNADPYTVIAKKGTMVTARRGGHQITRNTSFFKRVSTHLSVPKDEMEDVIEIVDNEPEPEHLNQEPQQSQSDMNQAPKPPQRRSVRERKVPAWHSDYNT
jgi:transposase InsO family protein